MWLIWIAGTALGVAFAAAIAAPERFGFDVIFICFFAILLPGLWKGRRSALPWGVAAFSALAAAQVLPAGWHVLVGGLSGGVVGIFIRER